MTRKCYFVSAAYDRGFGNTTAYTDGEITIDDIRQIESRLRAEWSSEAVVVVWYRELSGEAVSDARD